MNQFIYKNKKVSPVLLSFIIILLSLIAGFRPLEYFFDTETYIFLIETYNNFLDAEPTFWIINQFNQNFLGGSIQIFFLIYAILGVGIKIFAINNFSSNPIISVLCYIMLYYILYEMTAIRASVSVGLFLLALPDIVNRKWKSYFFKTILAVSFHYSAVIMLFFYFLNPRKLNYIFYFILPIILFFLSFQKDFFLNFINFISSFLPSFLEWKIKAYTSSLDFELYNTINRFNPFIISLCLIYYISLFNIHKFQEKSSMLLIKLLCFQISSFYLFYSIPPIAGRISQFIGISLVVFIPLFINIFKDKFISYSLISFWLIIYFISTIIKYTLLFRS